MIICGNHPKGCLPGRLPVCFLLVYINFIPAVVHSHRKAIIEGVDRGGGGTGIEGAESGVEGAESGVEGAGSRSRGGGKRGNCGRGSGKFGGRNCSFY